MRRAFCAFLIATPIFAGCAHAAPVTLTWAYPRFNAAPGTCSASIDTLKDLARVQIWAQASGQTDSTLVLDRSAVGKEAKPDSIVVNQNEGMSFYWARLSDLIGNWSCRSNVVSKVVVLAPSPAVMSP